jgi:hypothetical protein
MAGISSGTTLDFNKYPCLQWQERRSLRRYRFPESQTQCLSWETFAGFSGQLGFHSG